jgi:hypothetical protein
MRYKISIMFYGRVASSSPNGSVPIYLRITINGKRIEQATGRFLEPSTWSSKAGKMKGTHPEARLFNNYLDTLKSQVYAIERQMILSLGRTQLAKKCEEYGIFKNSNGYYKRADLDLILSGEPSKIDQLVRNIKL